MRKFVLKAILLALFCVSICVEASAISLKPNPIDSANTTTVDKTVLNNAMNDFKNLSRRERKSRITEAKKAIKDYKKNKSSDADTNTLLLCILAILLPPLAIYLKKVKSMPNFG
jgi:hypothetical protein